MDETLTNTLNSLIIEAPISRGPLHVFPLLAGGFAKEDPFLLLDDGIRNETLRVEELNEGGSVPELRVVNEGSLPVLILEGDELTGARQNRVVNSSVLVAAYSELDLPVSCVERGRWSYRSRAFSPSAGSPHLALRHLKTRSVHDSLKRGRGHRSDQDAVWKEVDRKSRLHEAASPTHALQDSRSHLSERLDAFEKLAEEFSEGSCGVVVALDGRPVLLEVLAGPRSFASVYRTLLSGYAFEAVGAGEQPPARWLLTRRSRPFGRGARVHAPLSHDDGLRRYVGYAKHVSGELPTALVGFGPFYENGE